tara:strand:- start:728 stop:1093 length:366 start_codon:yes stop_codon:yes gene_type:complete
MREDNPSDETKLWRAVVYQALLDASKGVTPNESRESVNCRNSARRWFTVVSGVTAAYFEDVCLLAGFAPEFMQQTAIRIIKNPSSFSRKRLNVLLRNEAPDESLWYTERFTVMASTSTQDG